MNYLQAREKKDGGWHFTTMNDNAISPIGDCKNHAPHATKEEAEQCYSDYLLMHELRLGVSSNMQEKCKVCSAWTHKYATIGNIERIPLCEDHQNVESLKAVWEAPTEIWSS